MWFVSTAVIQSYGWGSKTAVAWGVFQGAITIVSQGAIALVIWYGSTLIISKQMDIGDLISFMLYSITIAASAAMLASVFGTVMQAVGASERVFELLDAKPRVPIQGGKPVREGDGLISFQNVSFAYPSRPDAEVLKSVSFEVRTTLLFCLWIFHVLISWFLFHL